MNTELKTFSFRAECEADVETFRTAVQKRGIGMVLREVPLTLGETSVELDTAITLEELRDVIRGEADLYVMIQTLRELPLKSNSLIRDMDVGMFSFRS